MFPLPLSWLVFEKLANGSVFELSHLYIEDKMNSSETDVLVKWGRMKSHEYY